MNKFDFINWVLSEMKKARLRRTELARIGRIDHGYVSHVLNREQSPGFVFCQAVARALEIPESEVLYRAGLSTEKPPEIDQPGLREVMDAARQLSPDQREYLATLAKMIKSGSLVVQAASKPNNNNSATLSANNFKANVEIQADNIEAGIK